MKNLILTLTILFSLSLTAQKRDTVPADIQTKLIEVSKKDFPSSAAKEFKKTKKGNYKVSFKELNYKVSMTYSADFLLKSMKQIFKGAKNTPALIVKHIHVEYPGFEIKKYVILTKPEKEKAYKTYIKKDKEKKTLLFDKDHNFLKEKEKPVKEKKSKK